MLSCYMNIIVKKYMHNKSIDLQWEPDSAMLVQISWLRESYLHINPSPFVYIKKKKGLRVMLIENEPMFKKK